MRFNFAASNVLARQIVSGAPVDLFISADEAQMDVVAKAGLIVDGHAHRSAHAISWRSIVPDDRPRTFSDVRDLADPAFKRIAIGDPAAVPAGVYAKQYLERKDCGRRAVADRADRQRARGAGGRRNGRRRRGDRVPHRRARRQSARRLRGSCRVERVRASSIPPP